MVGATKYFEAKYHINDWHDYTTIGASADISNNLICGIDTATTAASTALTTTLNDLERAFKKYHVQDYIGDSTDITTGDWFSGNRSSATKFQETLWIKQDFGFGWNNRAWTITDPIPMPAQPKRIGGIYHTPNRKRKVLGPSAPNEQKARRLLQRLVGFRRYARYIRDGFLAHRGKSGRVYQIFPGYTHTRVWEKGEHIESLCLGIRDGAIPPTDNVVMRLLMLEHSEADFRAKANIWPNRKAEEDLVARCTDAINDQAIRLAG